MCYNCISFKAKRAASSGKTLIGTLVVPSCVETTFMFLKFIPQANNLQKFWKLVKFKFIKSKIKKKLFKFN